jgi:DnaJ-class molecular chaperone
MYHQIAPGMAQQMQTECSDCQGDGVIIKEKDRCTTCRGKKVQKRLFFFPPILAVSATVELPRNIF